MAICSMKQNKMNSYTALELPATSYQSNVSIELSVWSVYALHNFFFKKLTGFTWICRLWKYAILPYSIHTMDFVFNSSAYSYLVFLFRHFFSLLCMSFRKWFAFSQDQKLEIYSHTVKQSYWIVLLSIFGGFHHLCNNTNFGLVFSPTFIIANASRL